MPVKLTHTQLATLRALARFGTVDYRREWVRRGRYHVTSMGWDHYWSHDIPGGLRTVLALVGKGLVEADHEVLDTFSQAWAYARYSKLTFAAGDAREEEYTFTVSTQGYAALDDLQDAVLPHKFGVWRRHNG